MALDQWTDEQEIALLKAVVRWKPVGMHKHFRMLAIHAYMSSQGVVNPSEDHTKIPGIWAKLGTLYNLPILDDREDSSMNDAPDENGDVVELYSPFSLPEDEYGARMFAQRLDPDGSRSPDELPSRRESTVADTDEPSSSPVPGRRPGRKARGGARVSKLQYEVDGSRRTSKATSVNEEEMVEDAAEDADGLESEEEGEEAGEEEESGHVSKRPRISQGKGSIGRGSARRSTRKK